MSNHCMRAVRYIGPGQAFVFQTVDMPEPGSGEVRIRIEASGVCRTELHLRDGLLDLGRRNFTVGHEIAGTIEAVGAGVPSTRIGDRVVVYYYVGCGDCTHCRTGDEQLCASPRAQPGFSSDGGYAEAIVVPSRNAVRIPDHVSFSEAAPMGCAGSTAVHAGRLAGIRPGEWVVVNGAGGVGLVLLQYARHAGARVIAVGLGAERMALARNLGAEAAIDAAQTADVADAVLALTGGGADIVFELVGTTATMRAATAMLGRRGRMVLIGYTAENYVTHPIDLIVREASVIGSVGSTLQDLHEIVELIGRGAVRSTIDMELPLERFADGLEAVERGTLLGRVVLRPHSTVP
ncbi:MAG TPA: alcohol dehydrogenase catalytic domain-containing protein [Steroidobacteraceae bacterium]|nr:alcohol dehydrogenase catalytic domain-containing protein [Steroidobacteraceae bacterium]